MRTSFLGFIALSALAPLSAAAAPPVVTLNAQVADTSHGTLSYKWKVTEGAIVNANAATTTWTLPTGPGLHFAYVLVDNGLGGVAQARIAVSTDTIGVKLKTTTPVTLTAPAQAAQTADFYRLFVSGAFGDGEPGVKVFIQDTGTGTRYPSSGPVTATSSYRGDVTFANVLAGLKGDGQTYGLNFAVNCSLDGKTFEDCTGFLTTGPQLNDPDDPTVPAATSEYIGAAFAPVGYYGTFTLADGSACGTQNEFFNVHKGATAALVNASNTVIGTYPVSVSGEYNVPTKKAAVRLRLTCAGSPAVELVIAASCGGGYCGASTVSGVSRPSITGMTASMGATVLNNVIQSFDGKTPEAIFLPAPTGLPSDILARSDAYLAEKGLDSAKGACQYYKAVGAVASCTASGGLGGAMSFEDWKRTVQIDAYAIPGTPQYSAAYINQVDLNLMRVHQSISYSSSQTAAYVCNHLGPKFQMVTPQADIDQAISNGVSNKNLVACVAMDYSVRSGVNGNHPFTRFLIFGPSGKLLPSINLDGRAEKYVPGTCIACHGGSHYAGKYPEDGSGPANVGAHFLPYDTGNFQFSSTTSLTETQQETSIYHLNQNVLAAGPTLAEQELISGWYANGQTLNKNYLPASWQTAANQDGTGATATYYLDVVARSCRSCHVALREEYNFDHYANADPAGSNDLLASIEHDVKVNVCGGSSDLMRNFQMPNSLVTFNRMWLTYQNGSGLPDQITALQNFYSNTCGPLGSQ